MIFWKNKCHHNFYAQTLHNENIHWWRMGIKKRSFYDNRITENVWSIATMASIENKVTKTCFDSFCLSLTVLTVYDLLRASFREPIFSSVFSLTASSYVYYLMLSYLFNASEVLLLSLAVETIILNQFFYALYKLNILVL